ncbi:MAG TPA: outer membrane protein assembly factor BamB [Burkholderiaceae bacterium]|nr:outer membrane protein assembly factor BamB [Burkholderiaceae bacterium]
MRLPSSAMTTAVCVRSCKSSSMRLAKVESMIRRVFLTVVASALLSSCGIFGSDSKRAPAPLGDIKPQMSVRTLWTTSVGKSTEPVLAPALAGSTVIAANQRGEVTAVDAATGKRLWRVNVGFPIAAGVAADAETAIVGGANGMAAGLAVQDGTVRWKQALPAELLGRPAISLGLAVIRSSDARLFAVDARTGERKWTLQRPLPALVLRSDTGVAAAGELVYASFPGGRLLGVDVKTGAVRTDSPIAFPKGTTELERIADVVGVPAVSEDLVCAAAYQGRIACINASNGSAVWGREFSAAVGPALDARFVFGVSESSVVQAFARGTGGVLWTVDRFKYRDLSAPVSWGRAVAMGDYKGYVHILSREDGASLARAATDGSPIRTAPIVFEQGGVSRLIVQTSGGSLVALGAE